MDQMNDTAPDDFTLIEHLPFTTASVIGARARIGLVVLASDYTIEHEFRAMVAMPGVDIFMARIANDPRVTPETLAAMEPLLTDTAACEYQQPHLHPAHLPKTRHKINFRLLTGYE